MAGRNRNIDMKPEGVENDAEYKRLVRDVSVQALQLMLCFVLPGHMHMHSEISR